MTLSIRSRIVYVFLACALLIVLALPVFAGAPAGQLESGFRYGDFSLLETDSPPAEIACTGGNSQGACGGG